jgi:hypothetical protein
MLAFPAPIRFELLERMTGVQPAQGFPLNEALPEIADHSRVDSFPTLSLLYVGWQELFHEGLGLGFLQIGGCSSRLDQLRIPPADPRRNENF